jgi:hypothetical protein
LKDYFQSYFSLARNRDAVVADLRSVSNDTTHWDINFTRLVHDWGWTSSPLSSMFCIPLDWVGRVMIDYVGCPKKDLLRSNIFYKVLLPNIDSPFRWKSIWGTKAPLRLAFFTWTASLEKVLTLDNLRKHHIIVKDWCCMCKKSGETSNYPLHCDVGRELSNMVFFQMFGVEWVIMPRRWLIF